MKNKVQQWIELEGLMPYGQPEISDAIEYLKFSENVFNSILKIMDN